MGMEIGMAKRIIRMGEITSWCNEWVEQEYNRYEEGSRRFGKIVKLTFKQWN